MRIIVTFEWNGDKLRLAQAPQGDGAVPVGALREAAEALLAWVNGLPVQLACESEAADGGEGCD